MNETQIDAYLRSVRERKLAKPIRCRICRRCGSLRWHGSYVRRLVSFAGIHILPIRRLLCTLCRHTFGLLPSFVAKFHRYAKGVIRAALRWMSASTYDAVAERLANGYLANQDRDIAPLTLYLWRRKFGHLRPV